MTQDQPTTGPEESDVPTPATVTDSVPSAPWEGRGQRNPEWKRRGPVGGRTSPSRLRNPTCAPSKSQRDPVVYKVSITAMGGATVKGGQGGLGQKEGLSLLRRSGNSQGGLHTPEKANLGVWRCSEIIPDSKDRCKEMTVTWGPETWKQPAHGHTPWHVQTGRAEEKQRRAFPLSQRQTSALEGLLRREELVIKNEREGETEKNRGRRTEEERPKLTERQTYFKGLGMSNHPTHDTGDGNLSAKEQTPLAWAAQQCQER